MQGGKQSRLDQRLDRRDGCLENVGNLLIAVAVLLAQQEGGFLVVGQGVERVLQHGDALLAFDALLFGAIAMSLDLLIGYTGLVSFGHPAFYGLGAYATAVLPLDDAAEIARFVRRHTGLG